VRTIDILLTDFHRLPRSILMTDPIGGFHELSSESYAQQALGKGGERFSQRAP
jgi:hypothetical protein